jgi:gamma-glutamyl-gamma-aminobutyrate hydrolase PuuD
VPSDAPIIGISAGRVPVAGRVVDGTEREYADRISDAGGVPVLLPVQPTDPLASVLTVLDGLLSTGGEMWSPTGMVPNRLMSPEASTGP